MRDDQGGPIPTMRFPQRAPSRGLSWSKAQYPSQYAGANMVTNRLRGLDDRGNERFLDVANRAYSREFVTGFSYTNPALARPIVDVSYCRKAETFAGRIRARGLKPHFAYQIKLRGDYPADPVAFERIGNLGRWRRLGVRSTNFTDAEVAATRDKSAFESYIFFDFFVTDENGNAEKEFYLDSTLHVLFNQPYQGSPAIADSRAVMVRFTNTNSRLYANPKPSVAPHQLFAQTEAGINGQVRPDIGEAFLPPGPYRASLVLVEETLHGYGFGDSGFWPTVMECDVSFEVNGAPACQMRWHDTLPAGRPVAGSDFCAFNARLLNPTSNACAAIPDGSGRSPTLFLTNAIPIIRGLRQIAAFDFRADGMQELRVLAGTERWLKDSDVYRIPAVGHGAWQSVELEVTLEGSPEHCRLAFVLPQALAALELRNLRVVSLGTTNTTSLVRFLSERASP